MLNVLIVPCFTGNPYEAELAKALLKEDVFVSIQNKIPSLYKNNIRQKMPDILHMQWIYPFIIGPRNNFFFTLINSFLFIFRIIKLKTNGVSIVWTVHNIISHEQKQHHIELFIRKIFAKLCNTIIVHCNNAKKIVADKYKLAGKRIIVIPHGNYIKSYPNQISQQNAKKILKLESNRIFLIFGMIRKYKGIDKAIEAFASLQTKNDELLLIAGKPSDKQYLEQLRVDSKNNVRIQIIPKYVPDDEIQIYLNAADFVICPYENILTSGMVHLAMAFGKIILAPSIGCIPETLKESESIIYNQNEKNGLSNCIKKALFLSDYDKTKISQKLKSIARRTNWTDVAKMTKIEYEHCIKKLTC